jgi:invasion protein IalB
MARFGLLVPALVSSMLAASTYAQQPKAPQRSDATTPAEVQTRAARSATQSTWVKLCEKAASVKRGEDGKEEKKDVNICLTHHEQLDGDGKVLVSAALRQVEGQDKQAFMVMVPLGMLLQTGVRADICAQGDWEKAQHNEKVDDNTLKTISLLYTLCHPAGCTAEVEATPNLLTSLKSSGGFIIRATPETGASVAFPVPLKGFAEALNGVGEPYNLRMPPTRKTPAGDFWTHEELERMRPRK